MKIRNANIDPALLASLQASMKQLKQGQDVMPNKENQFTAQCIFRAYRTYSKNTNSTTDSPIPPPQEKKSYTNKEGKSATYLTKLSLKVQLNEVSTGCKEVRPAEDGSGWWIRANVSYEKETEKWIREHRDLDYVAKMDPDPEKIELIATKEIFFTKHGTITVKASDGPNTLYRAKNGTFLKPHTPMRFRRCTGEIFVALSKEKPYMTEEQKTNFVPRLMENTFITCSGASELDDSIDVSMPETERLHMLQQKDVHTLVPVDHLRTGAPFPRSTYFWAEASYVSTAPCATGITSVIMQPEVGDFMHIKDDVKSAHHTIRMMVIQWRDSPSDPNKEIYSVKIIDKNGLWLQFGITDMDYYSQILFNHAGIGRHVEADLWKNKTLTAEDNVPDNNNQRPEGYRGLYIFGLTSIIPDYLRYLPGFGTPISRKRVEDEFGDFVASTRSGGTIMNLHGPENPLHTAKFDSPVISFGNNRKDESGTVAYHGISGDVYPLMDRLQFFVLTSKRFTEEEEEKYVGLNANLAECDAFLDQLNAQGVYYWIFGVQKSLLGTAMPEPPTPASTPQKDNKRTLEEVSEEVSMSSEQPSSVSKKRAIRKKK